MCSGVPNTNEGKTKHEQAKAEGKEGEACVGRCWGVSGNATLPEGQMWWGWGVRVRGGAEVPLPQGGSLSGKVWNTFLQVHACRQGGSKEGEGRVRAEKGKGERRRTNHRAEQRSA